VRESCGNSHKSSEVVKCCLSHIFCQHFEQDYHSLQMADHFALRYEHLFAHPSLNILHRHHTVPSLITFWPKTVHNSWWISAVLMFLAWRKRITVWISQLAGLSVRGHIIIQSVETRTNTRWSVMWWFARQGVMWCCLTCTSFPALLH
jgi:hypothetical protein